MFLCATIVGLLCVAGQIEPPPDAPRLWIEQRAQGDNFKLVFIGSDARFPLKSRDITQTCRSSLCVRAYGVPIKCGMRFHVYMDGGAAPDAGDYYTLNAPSAPAYEDALSKIWVKPARDGSTPPLSLREISGLKGIPFNCEQG
jgi:hypothetical protein